MALEPGGKVHLCQLLPAQPVEGTISLSKVESIQSQEEPHAIELGRVGCCMCVCVCVCVGEGYIFLSGCFLLVVVVVKKTRLTLCLVPSAHSNSQSQDFFPANLG